jgi:hypothetical protein
MTVAPARFCAPPKPPHGEWAVAMAATSMQCRVSSGPLAPRGARGGYREGTRSFRSHPGNAEVLRSPAGPGEQLLDLPSGGRRHTEPLPQPLRDPRPCSGSAVETMTDARGGTPEAPDTQRAGRPERAGRTEGRATRAGASCRTGEADR